MILICKSADFSANKIGTITIKNVTSIAINGATNVEGMNTQLTCTATYSDSTTGSISPVWSIISGANYATIDQNGSLTILTNANNAPVVVAAEYDGKTTSKTITVTYRYAETYTINVADYTTNNGTSGTIQNIYGNVAGSNAAYTCILPAGSNNKLNILYSTLTVDGTTYSPTFRIVGLITNAYGTANGTTNNAARIVKTPASTYNGTIYQGWGMPDLPINIPYQYDNSLTTKNVNVPYIAISVIFRDANNNNLAEIAQYASQINLKYSITSE